MKGPGVWWRAGVVVTVVLLVVVAVVLGFAVVSFVGSLLGTSDPHGFARIFGALIGLLLLPPLLLLVAAFRNLRRRRRAGFAYLGLLGAVVMGFGVLMPDETWWWGIGIGAVIAGLAVGGFVATREPRA